MLPPKCTVLPLCQDNSLPESRPGGIQIDRKRLRKLREKKIAQGHKPDDHEEQWPQMTM